MGGSAGPGDHRAAALSASCQRDAGRTRLTAFLPLRSDRKIRAVREIVSPATLFGSKISIKIRQLSGRERCTQADANI
jgi:hypothetical protein